MSVAKVATIKKQSPFKKRLVLAQRCRKALGLKP